jgi:hypothetical protein
MSGQRSRGPWRLQPGSCWAILGILGADKAVAMLGRVGAISPADAAVLVKADELATACELFSDAAREAVEVFNAAGLPCPSSIALAAERARNALAGAHEIEDRLTREAELRGGVQRS